MEQAMRDGHLVEDFQLEPVADTAADMGQAVVFPFAETGVRGVIDPANDPPTRAKPEAKGDAFAKESAAPQRNFRPGQRTVVHGAAERRLREHNAPDRNRPGDSTKDLVRAIRREISAKMRAGTEQHV